MQKFEWNNIKYPSKNTLRDIFLRSYGIFCFIYADLFDIMLKIVIWKGLTECLKIF